MMKDDGDEPDGDKPVDDKPADDDDSEKKEDEPKPYMQNETRMMRNDSFYSGYFPVDDKGQEIFYMLFESRDNETKDTDPLLVWIRGEPGCSTTATIFENVGPFNFGHNETNGNPMLVCNPHAWNNFTNVLYIDQPVGTGFSFPREPKDGENNTRLFSIDYAVNDFVHFMKGFFDFYPQFRSRDMYLVGQDFSGGKYMPDFVQALQNLTKGEFEDEEFDDVFMVNSTKEWAEWINLKGIMMNGPMMDEVL